MSQLVLLTVIKPIRVDTVITCYRNTECCAVIRRYRQDSRYNIVIFLSLSHMAITLYGAFHVQQSLPQICRLKAAHKVGSK